MSSSPKARLMSAGLTLNASVMPSSAMAAMALRSGGSLTSNLSSRTSSALNSGNNKSSSVNVVPSAASSMVFCA